MDHPAITWIGWMIALLLLAPHARSWWRTYVLLGGIDIALIRQTLYLCRFTGNLYILIIVLAQIGFLIYIPLFGFQIPSGAMALMVCVSLVPLLRLCLPPAILFLAGSGDRANALFFQLHLSVTPLRVVALLDPQQMGTVGRMLRLDLMRTSNDNTWKSMVHRLIDIAPMFVIDTVHRTGPVCYEVFLMITPERAGRTIFISDDEGVCPSLLEEGIDPSEHAIPVVQKDDMVEAVHRLLYVLNTLPRSKISNSHSRIPIVPEDWNSLPSVLDIGLAEGLDGEFLLAQARSTDMTLIALLVPLSTLDENAAKVSIDLSWDFSRNPRLVGLYLENTGLVLVRREFLLQHPKLLDIDIPSLSPQTISFEDLNKPEPVGAAVHELCVKWKETAELRDLEFRFASK